MPLRLSVLVLWFVFAPLMRAQALTQFRVIPAQGGSEAPLALGVASDGFYMVGIRTEDRAHRDGFLRL